MRTRTILLAALLGAGLAAPASAQQRPLVTEDPETVGSGLVLIEGGFDYADDVLYPVSGLEGNLIRVPTLGVSFGLSSIAELQIDGGLFNHLSITSRHPAPLSGMLTVTGDSTHDVEDLVIGTKVRFSRKHLADRRSACASRRACPMPAMRAGWGSIRPTSTGPA